MPWSITDYYTNPALNTAINGIDIAENSAAAGYNNALRQMMADIKAWTTTYGVTTPVPIASGGTGATVAASALANLGGLSAAYRDLVRVDKSTNFIFSDAERAYGILWTGGAGTGTINPEATTPMTSGAVFVIRVLASPLVITRGTGVSLLVNGATVSANATIASGGQATLIRWGTDFWAIDGINVT
jgi:hypothetical protein